MMPPLEPLSSPLPPPELLERWDLGVDRFLGARANAHWAVSAAGVPLVLRRWPERPLGDVGYELTAPVPRNLLYQGDRSLTRFPGHLS